MWPPSADLGTHTPIAPSMVAAWREITMQPYRDRLDRQLLPRLVSSGSGS